MANKVPENLIKILKEIGETRESSLWDCHGTMVVYHKAIEKIANHLRITFDNPIVIETDIKNKCVAVMVRGRDSNNEAWSIGESAPYNTKNSYPYAMAEKRAKDRVVLKLLNVSGDMYAESEADKFNKKNNPNIKE
jgi:hypothetical protein